MVKRFFWAMAIFHLCGSAMAQSVKQEVRKSFKAYEDLRIPQLEASPARVITVAVVDDAFNLTHQSIKPYLLQNTEEVQGNAIDDDQNGYIDDVFGWDVGDQNPDVSVPRGRESTFYHGTMVASIVTQIAERCFGSNATAIIKLLPIKVVQDQANTRNYGRGYAGIEYAVTQNADIILCAWSGGKFDAEQHQHIFDKAQQKGILILGAAGNFYSEQTAPPASISSVYAIAALDTHWRKKPESNYGSKIDLSAFGELVYAAHPAATNTYGYLDGSSSAVALVAGCAAVLKAAQPNATPALIMDALKNTATPIDSLNPYYGGKLGAGFPHLSAALKYLQYPTLRATYFHPSRPKGKLLINKHTPTLTYPIAPVGAYEGFVFELGGNWKRTKNSHIAFYAHDSLVAQYSPTQFPAKVVIRAPAVRVVYQGKKKKQDGSILYTALPIDSTKLYCSDTRFYENLTDQFDDGSGPHNYAGNSSCKWQIKVPDDNRIKLTFDAFDTEAKTDFVYLFNGTETLPENLLAKFSGPDLPPVVVSVSNQVLLWFVTNKDGAHRGWNLKYEATQLPPGILPPPTTR